MTEIDDHGGEPESEVDVVSQYPDSLAGILISMVSGYGSWRILPRPLPCYHDSIRRHRRMGVPSDLLLDYGPEVSTLPNSYSDISSGIEVLLHAI